MVCGISTVRLKRLKFWPKTHPKCIKIALRGTHQSKFSRGRSPEPPLREGAYLSRTLPGLPRSCLCHSLDVFRRTTFKCVATGLNCNNDLFVKFVNNCCYKIIYHSFLVISRQISILKLTILTDIKMNFDEVSLKPFRINVFCVIRLRMLIDVRCVMYPLANLKVKA